MMKFGRNMGVLVREGSITLAEVHYSGGKTQVRRAAKLAFPTGDAAQSAQAIRQYLREHKFSARRCAVGLEGRYLVAREKVLPPDAVDEVVNILNLAAEREFGTDREHLTFDYLGPWTTTKGTTVQLVATSSPVLEQIVTALRGAGLQVTAVTSMGPALSGITPASPEEKTVLLRITDNGSEIILKDGERIVLVRWLPVIINEEEISSSLNLLCGEIRRACTAFPDGDAQSVWIWEKDEKESLLNEISSRLALPVKRWEIPNVDFANDSADGIPDSRTAAVLAWMARRGTLSNDFLHSRLAAPPKQFVTRPMLWVAAAGVVVFAVLIFWWAGVYKNRSGILAMQNQLEIMKPAVQTAKELAARVEMARGWYDQRPPTLECLRGLTLAFPENGRVWLTSLTFGEDQLGVCTGRADDEQSILELLDKLRAGKAFSQIKPQYLRQGGAGSSGSVSFAFSFRFESGGKQ